MASKWWSVWANATMRKAAALTTAIARCKAGQQDDAIVLPTIAAPSLDSSLIGAVGHTVKVPLE